jgi:hypothetical protein
VRRSRARAAAAAALFPALAVAPSAVAQDTAGLRVTVRLADAAGAALEAARASEPFQIRIAFEDAATGAPPAARIRPAAWLRRPAPGKPACTEAARAFRATGRLSRDDVALTGFWLLSVGEDNRLAVMDPSMPVGQGNTLALAPLDEPPGDLVVLDAGRWAAASRPGRGDVVGLDLPGGRLRPFAMDLGRPGDLLEGTAGTLWVADDAAGRAVHLDPAGRRLGEHAVGPGPVALRRAGPRHILAAAADGSALLLHAADGRPAARLAPGTMAAPFAATDTAIVAAVPGENALGVRYLDDLERPRAIPVAGRPSGLAVSADGRKAVAWSGDRKVDVIDLALGLRAHGFEAEDAVEEAAFAGSAVFLTYRSRPVVTVVDLSAGAGGGGGAGGEPPVRDVRLAANAKVPTPSATAGPRLVSLSPQPKVLVALPGSKSVFEVAAGGGIATAPMSILGLKSEPPARLAVASRSLRETAPGVFEASAQLGAGGGWELVVTTGVAGTTACAPIEVAGGEPEAPRPRLLVTAATDHVRAGQPAKLQAGVENAPEGAPRRWVELVVASLDGGWRRVVAAELGPDGLYHGEVAFPWPGLFPVTLLGRASVAPALVEVRP